MPVRKKRIFGFFLVVVTITAIFLFLPKMILAQVVINELLPNPSGDERAGEWVELFNQGKAVDVDGYRLKDASDHELVIGLDYVEGTTVVPAGGWLVIKRNNHPSFSLNNSGSETIDLWDNASPAARLVDSFSYSGSVVDKSWGRIPDGGDIFAEGLDPTPNGANLAPTLTPTLTPSPTLAPRPTATPKSPTLIPTPKIFTSTPTKKINKPTSILEAQELVSTMSGEILGEEKTATVAFYPLKATKEAGEASITGKSTGRRSWHPVAFLISGLVILFGAAFSVWYNLGKKQE